MNNTNIEFDQSDDLYVLDFISNRRFNKFNSNGEFINSYRLPFYKQTGLVEFKINTKNEIITSFVPVLPRENYTNILTHFNEDFKIVRKYGSPNFLYEHAYGKTYSQPHIDLSSNGDIYCAFHYPYLINVYREGKLLKIIKRDCSNFTKFSWIIQEGLPIKQPVTRSMVQRIFCLSKGTFIVIVRDFGKNYIDKYKSTNAFEPIKDVKTYLDLFDVEGRFLKSYLFERDTYGSIIHVDTDGYFYTNSKDGIPMLVKYKITFK